MGTVRGQSSQQGISRNACVADHRNGCLYNWTYSSLGEQYSQPRDKCSGCVDNTARLAKYPRHPLLDSHVHKLHLYSLGIVFGIFSVLQTMATRQQPVLWLEENDTGILAEGEEESSAVSIERRIIGEVPTM